MRPSGVIATKPPAPPRIAPVMKRRKRDEGMSCRAGDVGENMTATAVTTEKTRNTVPANSAPYSGAWLRNSYCHGSCCGFAALSLNLDVRCDASLWIWYAAVPSPASKDINNSAYSLLTGLEFRSGKISLSVPRLSAMRTQNGLSRVALSRSCH